MKSAARWGLLRRMTLLYSGLILGGFALALFVQADLGLDPWDVLHQGISRTPGWTLGSVVIASSVAVLALDTAAAVGKHGNAVEYRVG